jgi:hypothetical protein
MESVILIDRSSINLSFFRTKVIPALFKNQKIGNSYEYEGKKAKSFLQLLVLSLAYLETSEKYT